jgi:D-3-phosphoglycerate dehydrogenase
MGKALTPFPLDSPHIKILLLENVNTAAVEMLENQGYQVEQVKMALGEDELIARLKAGSFQAVGLRSKTKITAKVIRECPSVSPFIAP